MSGLVGYKVTNQGSGLHGIVVSARPSGGWRGDGVGYDIIWDDRSCSLKVSFEAMAASGWTVGERKVSLEECNRLWCDYQVERARRLEQDHATSARRTTGPIEVNRLARHRPPQDPKVVRMEARRSAVASVQLATEEAVKPASWHARRLLAVAMPGVNFALSVERKKLAVGWVDGPTPQRVEQALQVLMEEGRIERITIRRGATESFVQAAISMALSRVWGSDDGAAAQLDRHRVSASEYLTGSMQSVMTPIGSPIGSVPYAHLVRCLMEAWDFDQGHFIDVERTRYLRQEVSFLFPAGLPSASDEFQALLNMTGEQAEVSQPFPQLDRARG